MKNRLLFTAIALLTLCGISNAQITSGQYIMGNGYGIATVTVSAPNPMSGNYTVTVVDSNGGVATTSSATPTGNAPGEVESFGEMTTTVTDPVTGETSAGITVRGKNGNLASKSSTGKWKRAKKKPKKKGEKGDEITAIDGGGGGAGGGTPPPISEIRHPQVTPLVMFAVQGQGWDGQGSAGRLQATHPAHRKAPTGVVMFDDGDGSGGHGTIPHTEYASSL